MADQNQVVNVPGVGQINFPSSMSDDDISTAIQKNYPNLAKPKAPPIDAAFDAATRSPWGTPTAPVRPPSFPTVPSPGIATPEGVARRKQMADWQATTPQGVATPQDIAARSRLASTPSNDEIQQLKQTARLRIGLPEGDAAQDRLDQAMKDRGGSNPLFGLVGDMYDKYMRKPQLGQQLLDAVGGQFVGFDKNNPMSTMGTKGIPEFLAPKVHEEGTAEATEPWYKSVPRGAARGAYNLYSGMTTPEGVALAAGFGLAPESAIAKAGQAAFTGEAIKGAAESGGSGVKKLFRGDIGGAASDLTEAGGNALFSGLGLHEMAKAPETVHPDYDIRRQAEDAVRNQPVPDKPVETPVEPAIEKPLPGEVTPATPTKWVGTSPDAFRNRLDDPSLVDKAVRLGNDKAATLAVPVGGARKAGGLELDSNDPKSLEGIVSKLTGKPGFPNVRIEETPNRSSDYKSYTVVWGEPTAGLVGDPAALGKHYGYSDEAIEQFTGKKAPLRPETPPSDSQSKYPVGSISEAEAQDLRYKAYSDQFTKAGGPPVDKESYLKGLNIKGDHVIAEVPLDSLQEFKGKSGAGKEQAYAKLTTEAPPIHTEFSGNKLVIRDGNHRVSAAKVRGDETIKAFMPVEDYNKYNAARQAVEGPDTKAPDLEDNLRDTVGKVIRIQQLQRGAQARLNVEYALHQIRGIDPDTQKAIENENALADSKTPPSELSPQRQKMVETVAGLLGKTPEDLHSNAYRLSDAEVKSLKTLRKGGLNPLPLKGMNLPEEAFGDTAMHPLSDVNYANAKAAGISNAKDLWAQVPNGRNIRKEFYSRYGDSGTAEDVIQSGGQAIGQHAAESSGAVTRGGKDLESLDFEHENMQKVLAQRLKQARAKLVNDIPDWQQARINETEPSQLSKDIAALSPQSRTGIPKELYAKEHLGAKAIPGSTGSSVQESTPSTKASKVGKTSEVPAATPEQLSKNSDVIERIKSVAQDIQEKHGDEAFGATDKIFDAVNKKYKSPENVNKALLLAMKQYKKHLDAGVEEPLNKALADTVDKLRGEVGTPSTLYANPLGPIWQKLFGKNPTANVPQQTPAIRLPESPISKFVEDLDKRNGASNQEAAKAFISNEVGKIKDVVSNLPKFTSDSLSKVTTAVKAAWDAYKTRGGLSPLEWALGYRRLQLSSNALIMHEFHDRIMSLHPDDTRRTAMVNYLQASGGIMTDRDVNAQLQLKANSFAGKSALERKLQKGYVDAQSLTPAEKQTVAEYRAYDAHLNKEEAAQGLELHARENYVRQIWDKDSFARKQMNAMFSAGSYTVNPSFTKMRKFEDYFEGEQAGFTPHNKDLAYLVSARARASAEVLANRDLVMNMYNEHMPDGTKMAQVQGIGNSAFINDPAYPTLTDQDKKGAIYVKQARPADAITADGRPYTSINHPSFQNYKWVGQVKDPTTGATTEVLYKGNMLVHPDVAPQLKRILEPSAVRNNPVGKVALKASSIGKQTLLIGLFHPVQLGIHFTEHALQNGTTLQAMKALNPFSDSIIDLDKDPKQQQLVIHGMKVADFNAESLWDEGVMSRGFAAGAPVVGKFFRAMHDAMFQKYIPNLKMSMAMDALERNTGRYHQKYLQEELAKNPGNTSQQAYGQASTQASSRIYRMTAEQMNSAFGGINWDALPVNKTWQDVARLTVLAPDFLLARMQFVGDALRPGGRESLRPLLTGALLQYTAARAFNSAMNDGDPKWDIHDWNKFIVGHHEYSLRTVQGDLVDSVLQPRQFIQHRLNPLLPRIALEGITQKDAFGHPVTGGEMLVDFAKNVVPMPAQGAVDALQNKFAHTQSPSTKDEGIVDSLLQSFTGLQRKQYRTPAERSVFEDFDKLPHGTTGSDLALEQKSTFKRLREDYRNGKLSPDEIEKAINDPKGNLKLSEIKYLFRTKNETSLVSIGRQLEYDQLDKAWGKASPMEKMQLLPVISRKIKTLAPNLQPQAQQKLVDFYSTLEQPDMEKISSKIQDEIRYENPLPVEPEEQEPQ